jgi:hypothetical protein
MKIMTRIKELWSKSIKCTWSGIISGEYQYSQSNILLGGVEHSVQQCSVVYRCHLDSSNSRACMHACASNALIFLLLLPLLALSQLAIS